MRPRGPDVPIDPSPRRLPTPPDLDAGVEAAIEWVSVQLGDVIRASNDGPVTASARFRGGQRHADAALARTDLTGYAERRSEVAPESARGATGLSPYVRHGLLDLPFLWRAASDAPARDRDRFRDELLWQEYARHVYARLGRRTAEPLRSVLLANGAEPDPWQAGRDAGMACLDVVLGELETDGWLVNQARMWVASHWSVRSGADWRSGEHRLYRELVDGSRAANRLGWQWTVGTGTGRPYPFTRWQVERRAPGLCTTCPLADGCPIEEQPEDPPLTPAPAESLLRSDPDADIAAGPGTVHRSPGTPEPEAVWITAESLGDEDPALQARPALPAVFVLDITLLMRLQLHPRRLVFLAETLGDLATRRPVEVWRGDVIEVMSTGGRSSRPLAATFTPVPGWRERASRLPIVEQHPWRWLRRPDGGRIDSFSAWRDRRRR